MGRSPWKRGKGVKTLPPKEEMNPTVNPWQAQWRFQHLLDVYREEGQCTVAARCRRPALVSHLILLSHDLSSSSDFYYFWILGQSRDGLGLRCLGTNSSFTDCRPFLTEPPFMKWRNDCPTVVKENWWNGWLSKSTQCSGIYQQGSQGDAAQAHLCLSSSPLLPQPPLTCRARAKLG